EPHATQTSGFVPAGTLPAATASAPLPGGDAQHFVDGLDIPGQWCSLFKSAELNALIERGLANSPTLEAAQAALRQANENVAAQRGRFFSRGPGAYPTVGQKGSGAQFGQPGMG